MSKKNKNKHNKIDLKKKNQHPTPETTGHSWDGIEEYNTPAPRWWLIVWAVAIVWAVVYWFFYPAWPTIAGNTIGLNKWSAESQLQEEQIEIDKKQNVYLKRFNQASFDEIMTDPQLLEFALVGGKSAFKENCTACHGTGGQGSKGFPNLHDDDWLWGGKITDIYQTLKYGIRSSHDDTRISAMPKFGLDEILNKREIKEVAQYVMSLSDKKNQANKQINEEGQKLFQAQCAVCHGKNGKGDRSVGAPDLTDAIWLYGKSEKDIIHTIANSRRGVMPNWGERLSDDTIRQLAIYIHSLGGGE